MRVPGGQINIAARTRKLEIDSRLSLHVYYRIASSLLRQADIYRAEKNIVDLYVLLVRYCSLVSETIPCHRDYLALCPQERTLNKKRLPSVIAELESLKPLVHCQLDEINKRRALEHEREKIAQTSTHSSYEWPPSKNELTPLNHIDKQVVPSSYHSSPIWRKPLNQDASSNIFQSNNQFQRMLLRPKEETLSKHSILGPDGLRGRWQAPLASTKVQYPSSTDLTPAEAPCMNQALQPNPPDLRNDNSEGTSAMESVLSLDDGRWLLPEKESHPASSDDACETSTESSIIRQPTPPPVLAYVEQLDTISPAQVADPRPGPAVNLNEGSDQSKGYSDLHIPLKIMEGFLRMAQKNTRDNLETCGILAGILKNRLFYVTTLIIPKQESTSNTCQTTNEEEIFDVQDKLSLFPLGWIHTHPTQSCFMSSVDVHTHYSYQIMLPEAVAIVMAPTDSSRKHGIYHLSDPGGISVIRNCPHRGFHQHVSPPDGSPIYEHASHVYVNPQLKFEIMDLR